MKRLNEGCTDALRHDAILHEEKMTDRVGYKPIGAKYARCKVCWKFWNVSAGIDTVGYVCMVCATKRRRR